MRSTSHALRSLALLAVYCTAGLSQTSKTAIDNDQVKVLDVLVQPHQKTKLHEHKINRVMVYLQPGHQTIDYQNGKKTVLDWKAAEAKWSPASGMHIAEITSDNPVRIIEIEIKRPADPAKTANTALDPVKVDPKHYKVEFENDQVRVLRVKIGAHETTAQHEHVLNRVITYVTDQNFRVTSADGKVETPRHKAGEVSWGGPARHTEENLSDQPFEVVVVELKD